MIALQQTSGQGFELGHPPLWSTYSIPIPRAQNAPIPPLSQDPGGVLTNKPHPERRKKSRVFRLYVHRKCEVMQPLWKTVWEFLKCLNIELPPNIQKDHGQTIQKNDQLITSLEGSLTPVSSNWQEDKILEQPAPNGQELINN